MEKKFIFFWLAVSQFYDTQHFWYFYVDDLAKERFFFQICNESHTVYICKGGIMHFSACALSLLRFDCYTFAIDAIKVHQDSGTVGQFWTKNLEYFGHFWAFIFKKKRVFGWCVPTILMLFSAWSKTKNIFKIASKLYP